MTANPTAPAAMPSEGQIIEPDDYSEYLRKERTHGRYGYMQWQRAKKANIRADRAEAKAAELEARALAAEAALAAERERVEQLYVTTCKAHVAMTMACALPGVASEYDFSEAIASTEAALARRAAAIRAQGE